MNIKLRNPYSLPDYFKSFRDDHTVSGQDYDIMDLLRRFTRGERLNIKERPVNELLPGDSDESFENILPIVDDIVELQELDDQIKYSKEKLRKSRNDAKQSDEVQRN